MKLKTIIDFLEDKIPKSLALDFDNVGLMGEYDLDLEISSIEIFMDLMPEYDNFSKETLIITHHPPLFTPKTPTYTIHSNWDIIDGGANEALAEILNLEVIGYFDDSTKIGRVCKSNKAFIELKKSILDKFSNVKIVNNLNDDDIIGKVGVISGFGLKNPDYIKLAKNKDLDILISGDLTQESAILAKNLKITLIDLNHHESEVPGLYALGDFLSELNVDIKIIDKKPIEQLK
jgi:dinuclear metal center YbgI/SA1388 family protein